MQLTRAAVFLTICSVAALIPRAPAAAPEITFNQHIAPLLHRHCAVCHRPGEAAPFSLLSYPDAVKKSRTIARATESRAMPPWKAETASYPYRGERRLNVSDIELIQSWVKSGTPEGSGTAPEPP